MTAHLTRTRRRAVGAAVIAVAALLIPTTPASAAPSPATVVGTVTGPSGEVLAGVQVEVDGHGTVTTSEGRFTITGVTPGRRVRVFALPDPHYTGGTAPTGYVRTYSPYLRLPAGSSTTVDLRLRVGAGMAGRVVDDRTRTPLAGVTMYLSWTYDGTSSSSRATGALLTTAADGTWWVHGLDPQRPWFVQARPPIDSPTADAPFGYLQPREQGPRTLRVGTVTKGVAFRLVPYARIGGDVSAPAGSGPIVVKAGEGSTGDERPTAAGPFARYPAARYGVGGGTGPVCARGTVTPERPLGLALQCEEDVPFSATRQSTVSLTMSVGGAITGNLSQSVSTFDVWTELGGRRIDGIQNQFATGTDFTLGNLPNGTYVVHAIGSAGEGQSAPVTVVQGKVTKNVTIPMR